MAFTALFDANVLCPAPLRDLLLQLAVTKLFRARWTDAIHDEWTRAAVRNRPDVECEMGELAQAYGCPCDCLVTGFEPLIDILDLPDPNDRHVVAAAIKGRADVIVTFNLKHFPAETLNAYDIDVRHPDVFIRHLIDLRPAAVVAAARTVRRRLRRPPKTVEEYLEALERQGLVATVSELHAYEEVL